MIAVAAPARGSHARMAALALAAIVALGVWLRLRGITYGLPAVYNPDEIAIMSRALAFAKGDLNPHNFLYPTWYFYVLFGWIGAYFAVARVLGAYASAAAFERQFFVDPSAIYLAGRILGVVCGALTIAGVSALGRRLFDRATGLSAAALLAVAPFAVRDAHYVKHDVPVTLIVVLAYVAMARSLAHDAERRAKARRHETEGSWDKASGRSETDGPWDRASALSAALCGLACSTHYYAVFLALPLAWTIWIRSGRDVAAFVRSLAYSAAVAAVVFFAASPFILVEPLTAIRDVVANRQIVVDRALAGSSGMFASAGAYARMLVREAVGWPVLMLSIAGAVILAVRDRRAAGLVLSFPIAFLAFISNTVAAGRYLNPVLPFIALLAAVALAEATRALGRRAAPVAIATLTGIAAMPAVMMSVETGTFFRQTDTRTLAQRFIETAITPGSTIALQPYSTPLRPSRESLREGLSVHGLTEPAAIPAKFARQLALEPYPTPAYRLIFIGDGGLDQEKIYVSPTDLGGAKGLRALRERGVQYVVIKRYNTADRETLPFFDALAAEGIRVATFSPFRSGVPEREGVEPYLHNTDTPLSPALERPGPVIEIWKLS